MVLARIILGHLSIQPMTGYDLMRAFRSSAAYFWPADKAQIYRTLRMLVAEGFARTEVVSGIQGPDRIEHYLTDAGRAAFVEWLSSDALTHTERDELTARIFFADALSTEALLTLIEEQRGRVIERRSVLLALVDAGPAPEDRAAWLRAMTLDFGIRDCDTLLGWLDDLSRGAQRNEQAKDWSAL